MALAKGTNSYATVAEADAYFQDRIDVAAWSSASADQKSQALITATSYLDALNWTGVAVSDSQTLAFPRSGSYFDPRIGSEITLTTSVPGRVVKATYEMAYHLLNNDGLLDDTGGVAELKIGSLTLNTIQNASKLPSFIKRVINPLLLNRGSNMWWRAN